MGAKPQTRAAISTVQKPPPSPYSPTAAPTTAARSGPSQGSQDGGLGIHLDDAAPDLVQLDGVEQGLEIALAERLVSLALDDLEEDRPEGVLGEDLQQQAVLVRAVDQDAVQAHAGDVVSMARQALVDQVEIGVDRILEGDAATLHLLDGLEDVVGGQGDVLDALAVVAAQELLDLAVLVLALVQGDADGAVGRDHRLGQQAGRLALDVEVFLLFEIEDVAVETRPGPHLAAAHVVGQVVEHEQADGVLALGLLPALDLVPAVVERALLAILVDDVEQRSADALQDVGIAAAQGAAVMTLGRTGAARHRAIIGRLCVP